jgi:hypothetical protein
MNVQRSTSNFESKRGGRRGGGDAAVLLGFCGILGLGDGVFAPMGHVPKVTKDVPRWDRFISRLNVKMASLG